MLSLLLAVVAATAATSAPNSQPEAERRAVACMGLLTNKMTPDEVISNLNLKSDQQVVEFVNGCAQFALGFQIGVESEQRTKPQNI